VPACDIIPPDEDHDPIVVLGRFPPAGLAALAQAFGVHGAKIIGFLNC
jgi:hypothetical protein